MKTIKKEDIIYLFSQKSDVPLSFTDIKHNLPVTSAKTLAFVKNILDLMVNNGELILTKGEKYAYPQKLHLIRGKVLLKKHNYAFVSDNSGGGDIFVKNSDIGDAIPGDTVILKIIPDNSYYLKKKNREKSGGRAKPKDRRGRVIRIIKRELKYFKAVARVEKNIAILTPVAPEFDGSFYCDLHRFKGRDKLKNGAIVNAVLPDTNDFSSRMALVDRILGDIEAVGTEEDIIASKYSIYESFGELALKELDEIPANFEEDWEKDAGRVDLTGLPFITIDGEDAKDFDDAVFLESSKRDLGNNNDDYNNKNNKLYVAIADVSYFVKQGSHLDSEALKRGNSFYFPNKVYPMLPERLSNDLCSLLPQESRFVMVCEMDIDNKGKINGKRIYKGLIKTFGRLTYNEVYKYLTFLEAKKTGAGEKDAEDNGFKELNGRLYPIKGMLLEMKRLAGILRNKRIMNGSLDFDSISSKVILNGNNEVIGIVPEERNFAHELIEDFMIAANCAVAQFIEFKKVPGVYRVHEKPDEERVQEFLKVLKYFKFSLPRYSLSKAKDYQAMLNKLKGMPLSSFLEQAFLRSMKVAVYSPVNIHHFGLALRSYTHFTSPIRRYADLTVHRILNYILYNDSNNKEVPAWLNLDALKAVSNALSRREKLSADAEREYSEFKKMQFLKKNSQKVYEGFITNVINFGFFVDIAGFFIQGFVHISTIADDYYEYNDNTKTLKGRHNKIIFKIGDRILVSVYSINLLKREIDLRFIKFYEDDDANSAGLASR
ncbi:MAG: ribonuclease R [Deltaproteobacteria bacterium]|nr:ribonuclease R [Deltaproteobacteria bacterium]